MLVQDVVVGDWPQLGVVDDPVGFEGLAAGDVEVVLVLVSCYRVAVLDQGPKGNLLGRERSQL